MARDSFILGEIGDPSSIDMEVMEFAENSNYRGQGGPFDENRRGGFYYPRRYGPTQITMEVFLKTVLDGSNDELDLLFGEFRSKVYTLTQTSGFDTGLTGLYGDSVGLTKLWTMDNYYYEVVLENIVERERTMYSVLANVSFIAPKGLKVHTTPTIEVVANLSVFTWLGSVAPDVYVDIITTIGVPVTFMGITITPTSAGKIVLDCTRGKAWRDGTTSAMSEISGVFPSFLGTTVILLSGVATATIYYRRSIL